MENRENALKITQRLIERKCFNIARKWCEYLKEHYGEEETKDFFELIDV